MGQWLQRPSMAAGAASGSASASKPALVAVAMVGAPPPSNGIAREAPVLRVVGRG
jgi:hypothetical protein